MSFVPNVTPCDHVNRKDRTLDLSTVQAIKLAIGSATGLSGGALHMYVGLAVLLAAVVILKKPLGSIVPWMIVLTLSITGELIDMQGDIMRLGYWRWGESLFDMLNTIFWPTVLLLFDRSGIFMNAKSPSRKPGAEHNLIQH